MAVLTGLAPARVQGLPQPTDHFPRRYRNHAPLVIRQIIPQGVLDQWASDPEYVIQALNQSVQEQQQQQQQQKQERPPQAASKDDTLSCGAKQETVLPHAVADPAAVLLPYLRSSQEAPPLPVMVAEDTKNFMDDPQFTKTITMTAREIVARVLIPRPVTATELSSGVVPTVEDGTDVMAGEMDTVVPSLHIQDDAPTVLGVTPVMAAAVARGHGWMCPLCDQQANDPAAHDRRRFYYRGAVPSSLYRSLRLPDLLSSLSLPTETTAFAKAPNKDLMRIWISLAGATTPLHYDRCHGILIQLVGRKRFVVFSHEDTNALYPYDGISGPGHASKVRGLAHCFPFTIKATTATTTTTAAAAAAAAAAGSLPGVVSQQADAAAHLERNEAELLGRWPKVRNTTPWVIDLEPGDALYTPPGFWHEVTSVDHSISITVPWDMDASELEHVPRHMF
ncbi:unnamed protein product [Mortierella alpina]